MGTIRNRVVAAIGLVWLLSSLTAAGKGAEATVPIDLEWGPDGLLHVAERDARRISVVDPDTWKVTAHWALPFRPTAIRFLEGDGVFVIGGEDGQLLVTSRDGIHEPPRRVGRGPTRLLPWESSKVLVVCRWDPYVRVIDFRTGDVETEHSLSFPPKELVQVPGNRVVVSDAFGGSIALLEPGRTGSEQEWDLGGYGLRGLAYREDSGELLLAQMTQLTTAPATRTNVDWGVIVSSKFTAVRLPESVGPPAAREHPEIRRLTLDGSGHGAADPSALVTSLDGKRVLIALAGAHQVLAVDRSRGEPTSAGRLGLGDSQAIEVTNVGLSPADLVLNPTGELAVTADSMSDTLTVFDVESMRTVATVRLGPGSVNGSPAQQGEAAFRDGRASLDRWMSCSTCHTDAHTNGRLFDTLGDGDYGAPKLTPSLLGSGETAPYAWTGRFARLEDQVEASLRRSLHGPAPTPAQIEAIASFLRSVESPPPRRTSEDPAVARGATLFHDRRCTECHQAPTFTSSNIVSIGSSGGPGRRERFNPPSLRGVAWRRVFFHDGRARTLSEAVESHHPGVRDALMPQELADLVAYLESL